MANPSKPACIVFDVNETLLDMTPLKEKINALFNNELGFKIWFGLLLQYSLVDNSTGVYHPFPEIAKAALDLAATALETTITEEEKRAAISLITQLPPHKDVKAGLQTLKAAGFRLITLTNSPLPTLTAQLSFSGLDGLFEKSLSIDAVQRYKPSPETYRYAAETVGEKLECMMMVAAHGWDIAGAAAAGMQTAFIARKGQGTYALSESPTIYANDLVAMAEKIISL